LEDLNTFQTAWLGRKGRLTLLLKKLGDVSLEKRKTLGKGYNELKVGLEKSLADLEKELGHAQRTKELEKDTLDTTLPGVPHPYGTVHPITRVIQDLVTIFRVLGFVVADGPE